MTPKESVTSNAKCLRNRKNKLKADGMCQDCGSEQAQVLRTLCTGCLQIRRANEQARYARNKKLDNAQGNA